MNKRSPLPTDHFASRFFCLETKLLNLIFCFKVWQSSM